MKLEELIDVLTENPDKALDIMLPDGDYIPEHFHITEVGLVQKKFVDCGGTKRELKSCLLQVWVASDVGHRLGTTKLLKILNLAKPMLGCDDVPVEIEYEGNFISQFPLAGAMIAPAGVLLSLSRKHTACLAPDKCGVSGCC
jgi:hypothetical protein